MSVISARQDVRVAPRAHRGWVWLLLLALVAAAIAVVIVPAWIIQPFKYQTEEDLALSYTLRRWSPWATLAAAVASVAAAFWLWRGARWFGKVALVLVCAVAGGTAWLSRQNHFEWFFRPVADVAHAPAAEADWVKDDEMVLAIEHDGDAVAYPVRQLAYHHVVEDVVGGVPIVATY
jgi:hypothetical protein